MGIKNFSLLLKNKELPFPEPFDSILVDVQSLFYVAINYAVNTEESAFIQEVSNKFQSYFFKILNKLLKMAPKDVIVIVSFDGQGVPMKWSTQRERRQTDMKRKALYRSALFGNNTLSAYFFNALKGELPRMFNRPVRYVLSGCDIPGEGEHKMFDIGEKLRCRRPVVVSVDNDVYFIALFRMDRYETIQVYNNDRFYDVARCFARKDLMLPLGFLFGNDFLKELFYINETSVECVNEFLEEEEDVISSTTSSSPLWPVTIHDFLKRVESKMRFSQTVVDRGHLVDFWMTCLWIRDYYRVTHFPQKYMANLVRDAFDRDALLTGLTALDFSIHAFLEACESYSVLETEVVEDMHHRVFEDEVLEKIERFIIPDVGEEGELEIIIVTEKEPLNFSQMI